MKKNFLLGLALFSLSSVANAQEVDVASKYIRNSVYMMKLDMPADNADYQHAYEVTNATFDGINFANRYSNYNDFSLNERHIDWGKVPTATAAELDAIGKESKKALLLKSTLEGMGIKVDPISEREYAARLLNYFKANKVGNQLVAKWHIKEGVDPKNVTAWDESIATIMNYARIGLSDEQREQAKATQNLTDLCGKSETKVLSTTYVCVNDYRMMTAEEKTATAIALAKVALNYLPGPAKIAGQAAVKAAEIAAANTKGYFVKTNAYLFKLNWDENVQNEFYNKYWKNTADFNANADYQLSYVGKSSKSAGAGLTMKSAKLDMLIARGALRATDAAFAALQRDYEEFRPMSALHVEGDKLVAYIGTKEGVKEGDKFDVFQPIENKDHTIEWKKVGSIKVAKKGVWNNIEGANEVIEGEAVDGDNKDKEETQNLQYTIFDGKPSKKVGNGCMIRLAK